MSDTPPDQERSLRDELRKRRTQAAQQAQARPQQPSSSPTGPTKPKEEARPPQPPAPASPPPPTTTQARTQTQTARRVTMTTPASGKAPTPNARQLMIGLVVVLLVVVVVLGGMLVSSVNTPSSTPTPTRIALPLISAHDLLAYLQRAGVQISNIRSLEVPNDTWQATEGVQFEAVVGNLSGTFIILSYATTDAAGSDAFKAEIDEEYGPWKAYTIANIMVLSTPETPQQLNIEIASHATTYIAGTVISFLPTSTGTFIGAAVTDSAQTAIAYAATQAAITPTLIIPTAPSFLVTLTPRPPTATRTATLTRTPRPTRTNTVPVTDTPRPPTRTPRFSGTGTELPAETLVIGATETFSPFMMTPTEDQTRAQQFANAAPRFLDPLRLDTTTIVTDQFGVTLEYVTTAGVRYPIVLFITGTVADARARYDLDKTLATGAQQLAGLGDESILYAPGNLYLAELLYQDMVLLVYNPSFNSTVPPGILSQDDLLRLLQRLYIILPAR
ncbi:MAG: hypothetical protein KF726_24395 [Anaerolineae bacterium]|nr:hypothetical protein [Anaerolineae bacterium]